MRDETMTGREIHSWMLPGLPDKVTARELVQLRVREEVARSGASPLVRPARPGPIDWPAQAEVACAAFARNGFVMIVGEHQVEDLDEVIDLRETPSVSFIRLVPLVGG